MPTTKSKKTFKPNSETTFEQSFDSQTQVFSFKFGGEAGFGIMSTGLTFSKLASRSGYNIFDYSEYPSIIRGGHNIMQICVSTSPIHCQTSQTDFLIALNQETLDLHLKELTPTATVLFDSDGQINTEQLPSSIKLLPIPLKKIALEIGGSDIMKNTAALGALIAIIKGDLIILKNLLAEEFIDKKPELILKNQKVAQAGFDFVQTNFSQEITSILKPKKLPQPQLVINGNEAIGLAAIAAGLQFVSIYPMTPVSGLLHFLAAQQEEFNFIYKQPEDEIAAINLALGASFAGARAMTATSGGGFCLMTEGYGLAGMTETPLVIIEGMRGSPATGLPTWTEQGDLQFVLHAHQGDFPRIVLAAGDVTEAFQLTLEAFNLADKYQTPVVILADKQVLESHLNLQPFNLSDYKINRGLLLNKKQTDYLRYKITSSGISPRSLPGIGNHFVANSDEHNEAGYSDESPANRQAQMEKRMAKLQTCVAEDLPAPKLFGPAQADLTLISWGSNKGAILDTLQNFPNVNYLHLTWLSPFPVEAVTKILTKAKHILDIECNYSAQLAALIKEKTGLQIQDHLLKYTGRPFYSEEIAEKIKSILN